MNTGKTMPSTAPSAGTSNKFPHVENYKGLRKKIELREQQKFSDLQLKDMAFLSANLENFLPAVSASEYEKIYMNVLFGRALLNEETDMPELIGHLDVEGLEAVLTPGALPAVFCTYHLGSYRSIIGVMASKGIDFVLIVDENTYRNQSANIKAKVSKFHKAFGVSASFDILNAELPDIAMTLSRCLREGKSVIAYIDGNTGSGGIFHKSEVFQLKVRFLDREIYSRKGIAAISWMSKRPIIPVISYYTDGDKKPPTIKFLPPIYPTQWADNPKAYVPDVTTQLYAILEKYLVQYYDQWETWLYLHKYLPPRSMQLVESDCHPSSELTWDTSIAFNDKDFSLFRIEADCFLLNKRTYECFQISEPLFRSLLQAKPRQKIAMESEGFNASLIEDFVERKILKIEK